MDPSPCMAKQIFIESVWVDFLFARCCLSKQFLEVIVGMMDSLLFIAHSKIIFNFFVLRWVWEALSHKIHRRRLLIDKELHCVVLRIIRWRHLLSKVTICCDAILTLLAAIALEEVVWHEKVIMGVGTSSLYIKINHLISSQSKQGIGFVSRSEETPYK